MVIALSSGEANRHLEFPSACFASVVKIIDPIDDPILDPLTDFEPALLKTIKY